MERWKLQEACMHLAQLRGRYDDGAVSPAMYAAIKAIETDIWWLEHRRRMVATTQDDARGSGREKVARSCA